MSKEYDAIVFIGRFQPFHNAHLQIFKQAATLAEKVILVVGSAYQPRTYKNPFTSEDRYEMISLTLASLEYEEELDFVIVRSRDSLYNDTAWSVRVQEIVKAKTRPTDKVAIIGHKKDESSYYLEMFPQWELVEVPLVEELSATNIRDLYFREDSNLNFIQGVLPERILEYLEKFKKTEEFAQIVRERKFEEIYKQQFASYPYPPTFVTVDAVVIQSGHILMINRRAEPGRGLLALPGGFLDAHSDASLEDAMIREIREETGLKVPSPALRGNIKNTHVFDAIQRSSRGRTITHAFNICLPDGDLPKVRGGSDALSAKWIPLSQVDSSQTFEDHYEIISYFTGI
jgi:bifunctional NMN adenylyltransferase/nudix hydrolase